jgi:transcription antitermination factor NusG
MKIGERVKIKTGLWAGTIAVVAEINRNSTYPIRLIETNGREHNEQAENIIPLDTVAAES